MQKMHGSMPPSDPDRIGRMASPIGVQAGLRYGSRIGDLGVARER